MNIPTSQLYPTSVRSSMPPLSHYQEETPTAVERSASSHRRAIASAFVSTSVAFVRPASLEQTQTAKPSIKAWAPDQRLGQDRTDLRMLERIRKLALYPPGWDGLDAKSPVKDAINNAERFIRTHLFDEIEPPHISVATDGEINFLWILPHIRLDLGFYGDHTYSYYGRTNTNQEFICDERCIADKLPVELIKFLQIQS